MGSDPVTSRHLARCAVIYVRQSTPHQVLTNRESLRLQHALQQRAQALGWHEADIEVVDVDLCLSGASTGGREGFKVDDHRAVYGGEPICRVLRIARRPTVPAQLSGWTRP